MKATSLPKILRYSISGAVISALTGCAVIGKIIKSADLRIVFNEWDTVVDKGADAANTSYDICDSTICDSTSAESDPVMSEDSVRKSEHLGQHAFQNIRDRFLIEKDLETEEQKAQRKEWEEQMVQNINEKKVIRYEID